MISTVNRRRNSGCSCRDGDAEGASSEYCTPYFIKPPFRTQGWAENGIQKIKAQPDDISVWRA